jgi:uncharacterized protein YqeY
MFNQINADINEALKSGNKFELSVLRMLKSEVQNAEITKKEELNDDEITSVIKKQVKIRKDSKTEYENYDRTDLAQGLEKEIEILSKYLPEELSEEAIFKIIDEVISETGAADIKSMGTVMKTVAEKCGASADMSLVSKLVKEKLSQKD